MQGPFEGFANMSGAVKKRKSSGGAKEPKQAKVGVASNPLASAITEWLLDVKFDAGEIAILISQIDLGWKSV